MTKEMEAFKLEDSISRGKALVEEAHHCNQGSVTHSCIRPQGKRCQCVCSDCTRARAHEDKVAEDGRKARHSSARSDHMTPPEVLKAARGVLGGTIDLDPASSDFANTFVQARKYFTEGALEKSWEFGLEDPEQPSLLRGATVFLNPPGGKLAGKSLPVLFWRKLVYEWTVGRVKSAIFVAFSLEILQTTQTPIRGEGTQSLLHVPTFFPFCVPRKRMEFLTSEVENICTKCGVSDKEHSIWLDDSDPAQAMAEVMEDAKSTADHNGRFEERLKAVPGESPTHANAIIYLPEAVSDHEGVLRRQRQIMAFRDAFITFGDVVIPAHWGPR